MTALVLATAAIGRDRMPSAEAGETRPAPVAVSRTVVDPAVVPAGGCRGCNAPACRACRSRQPGHHAGCRDGACHPHCPVRPQEFGFYGTQWRRWPDTRVVPAAAERADTPVLPPRSELPRSDEESPRSSDGTAGAVSAPEPPARADEPDQGPAPDSLPQPPQGAAEPDAPLVPPAVLEPRSPPQSRRGEAPRPIDGSRRLPGERKAAVPRFVIVPPGLRPATGATVAEAPVAEAPVAPEPGPTGDVVHVAAEDDVDATAVGPSRRRFVARRMPLDEAGGTTTNRPAAP